MKIQVTKENIKQGKKQNCSLCPVALALIRDFQIHDKYLLVVSQSFVNIGNSDGLWMHFNSPLEVYDFINKFDNGETVEPFEFELTNEMVEKFKKCGFTPKKIEATT